MKYCEIIKLNKNFQYSINLQYDLLNDEKSLGYIPTKESVHLIKEYLRNILLDENDKATVLIGPYGKGKSHLLLVLLSILYKKETKFKKSILKKLKEVDNEAFELAERILKDKKKMLPIIINSNNSDLNQSFLVALNEALKRENLEEIRVNTYFDTVLEIVNLWKEKYPETLKVLEEELKKRESNLSSFIKEIKGYSSNAYKSFLEIYPIISSGIEFNPMQSTDVVKLYEEINNKLCNEYGFKGVFIVFDEFSKFIEASVDINNAKDLKILQDFAELANRSKGNQIHLACVTHKSINQYIAKIPNNKIDAWRAIEGRFKEYYFTTSSKQNFELIGNTIKIEDEAKVEEILAIRKIGREIDRAYSIYEAIYKEEEYKSEIAKKCFPLSPITTYCLPRISEKVAQNERTLFTFLCKRGENTVWDFINNNQIGKLLEVDKLYDYFEGLFKKEIFNEKIRDIWVKTDSILKRVYDNDNKRIVKALAIVNIVDSYENLPPTRAIFKSAFLNFDTDAAIERLLKEGLLLERKNTEYLDYMPNVSVDLNKSIEDTIKTKLKKTDIVKALNELFRLEYITPKRYNDENQMTRFFESRYIDATDLKLYESIEDLIKELKSDGLYLNVICKSQEQILEIKEKIKKDNVKNIIFNIPNNKFTKENEILTLLAINYLREDKNFLEQDEALFEYLDILAEDVEEDIKNYLSNNFELSSKNSDVINGNIITKISSEKELNILVSDICKTVFNNTVKINNEMINKAKITAPILKARTKVIEGILNNSLEFDGSSPEVTISRATIKNKGLDDDGFIHQDIKVVLEKIREFILDSEKEKLCFEEIYEYLEGFKDGVGMRRGIIPIYISYAIKEFIDETVIYFGKRNAKEAEIDENLFNLINENPKDYYIKLDKGTKEKEEYFEDLNKLFEEKMFREISRNKYTNLVANMQEWIKSLDNFTRNHNEIFLQDKKIDKRYFTFRKELLKYDINSREFVFETLPKIFKIENYEKVILEIKKVKKYFESRKDKVKDEVIKFTTQELIKDYKGSLTESLKIWYRELDKFKKEHLYDVVVNKFIKFAKELESCNEDDAIEEIVFILTGLSISDWNDTSYNSYKESLKKCLDDINSIEETVDEVKNNTILLKFGDGDMDEKRFSKEEITPLGSTLLNELEEIVEEYSASLSDNEKRTILVSLLEKLM